MLKQTWEGIFDYRNEGVPDWQIKYFIAGLFQPEKPMLPAEIISFIKCNTDFHFEGLDFFAAYMVACFAQNCEIFLLEPGIVLNSPQGRYVAVIPPRSTRIIELKFLPEKLTERSLVFVVKNVIRSSDKIF